MEIVVFYSKINDLTPNCKIVNLSKTLAGQSSKATIFKHTFVLLWF